MIIKKLIAYIVSWTLYWMGDFVSHIMHLCEWCGNIYPLYSKLMCMSLDVQDWAGNETPWSKTKNQEEQ